MLHDEWLDIRGACPPLFFHFNPGMVSDRSTQRNIFITIFLCSLHKGKKVKAHAISQKCLL
jgi:hypothetical protein